jgi:hypothetical protein
MSNLDINFLKSEVNKIYDALNSGVVKREVLLSKYKEFQTNFPSLMDNILKRKMSREEVMVLLDTFGKAQDTFNNNVKVDLNN